MDVFKRALEYIRRMWSNLNTSQRVLLGACSAAVVLFLAWGSVSGVGEGMVRVVGHEQDEATRGEVLKKLQEMNEKYEVRNGDIYLPRETADRVVLQLAGDGIMSDRAVWDWLASSDIVAGQWQLQKRYQVALQRKLEIMIRKIESVRSASVVLSPASEAQQLGFRDGAKAGAAVQVELRAPHAFGAKQAKAIAGLVARAVPGLETDRVIITDTQGNAYRIPRDTGNAAVSGDIRDLEARLEEDIKAKIQELFRNARVVVRCVAKTGDVRTREEKYGKQVPRTEQEQQRVVKNEPAGGAGGIKGEGQLTPDRAGGTATNEKETSTQTENLVDKTIRELNDPAGSIEKITIGVLIPQDPDEKDKMPSLEDTKALIAKAAAIPMSEDVLTVRFFPTTKPPPVVPTPAGERIMEWLGANLWTVVMVSLALLALLFLWKVLKAAMPRGTVEEIQALTAQLTTAPEIEVPQAVLTSTDSINRVKQSIQDVISRNPAGAAVGLKQWMGEAQK